MHGHLGRMVTKENGWRRVSEYHLHFQGIQEKVQEVTSLKASDGS